MPQTRRGRPRSELHHKLILQTAIDLVIELGFREVSIESIAARAGLAKTTIYRRWPNKASLVMDAFMIRFGSGPRLPKSKEITETIRTHMRRMAKVFRSKEGALLNALLAEAQFDTNLAAVIRERWTLPRRRTAVAIFQKAITRGELRADINVEASIDLLYAPMYYRLQMGTGFLSDAYIDKIFDYAMKGLVPQKGRVEPMDTEQRIHELKPLQPRNKHEKAGVR